MNDRTRAIAQYSQHIEEVKAAVPPDQLLIFTVDQDGRRLRGVGCGRRPRRRVDLRGDPVLRVKDRPTTLSAAAT
jgi:hypothetical protein